MDSGIFFTASRNQCTCWSVIAMLVSWLFSASCDLFQPPSPLPPLWHSRMPVPQRHDKDTCFVAPVRES